VTAPHRARHVFLAAPARATGSGAGMRVGAGAGTGTGTGSGAAGAAYGALRRGAGGKVKEHGRASRRQGEAVGNKYGVLWVPSSARSWHGSRFALLMRASQGQEQLLHNRPWPLIGLTLRPHLRRLRPHRRPRLRLWGS
jgi:hypothetical protein